jgi:Rrf2 family protein
VSIRISYAGEYAIRSMVYLAAHSVGHVACAQEIATAEGMPVADVRGVCETLLLNGLLASADGSDHGLSLAASPERITLRDILKVVEGPLALNRCLDDDGCQHLAACPVSPVWAEAQRAVESVLGRYTLADIARSRELRRRAGLETVE